MRFSGRGHDVAIVDNFARRRWVEEAGSHSLTPIGTLEERIEAWREVSGKQIESYIGDIAEGGFIGEILRDFEPSVIVHYGEQPSAPWSMKSVDHAVITQANNVIGSLKLLWAMREQTPDAHLIKLGTMGEYGMPNIDIEEGFIEIEHKGRRDTLPFPKLPGSLYHLSKVHDSHNIHFACRVWGLRATDLNQGVVYGIETPETRLDDRLMTRFDYDELIGTEVQVDHVANPRLELEEHYYNPTHTKLLSLGLRPMLLSETLIESMLEVIRRHQDRVLVDVIAPVTQWRPAALAEPAK